MTDSLVRRIGSLLPAAAVVWAMLVVAAPWLGDTRESGGPTGLVGAMVYATGALVCHQRPERSFHTHGAQWPVCARCAGLYLSAAVGVVAAWAVRRRAASIRFHAWRPMLIAAAVPLCLTVVLEWWNPACSSGFARAISAAPLGGVVGVLLAASMSFQGRLEGCERTR